MRIYFASSPSRKGLAFSSSSGAPAGAERGCMLGTASGAHSILGVIIMRTIVNIDVPDLEKGIEFYTQIAGLNHTRTIDNDVAELTGASTIIYLLQKDTGSSVSKNSAACRNYDRHWTPVHLDFVVDNINDAKRRAIQAGARCESDCVQWMGSKCITFSDPFGHGFCLLEFSGDTYSEKLKM